MINANVRERVSERNSYNIPFSLSLSCACAEANRKREAREWSVNVARVSCFYRCRNDASRYIATDRSQQLGAGGNIRKKCAVNFMRSYIPNVSGIVLKRRDSARRSIIQLILK